MSDCSNHDDCGIGGVMSTEYCTKNGKCADYDKCTYDINSEYYPKHVTGNLYKKFKGEEDSKYKTCSLLENNRDYNYAIMCNWYFKNGCKNYLNYSEND